MAARRRTDALAGALSINDLKAAAPVEGAAFSRTAKALALALCAVVLFAALRHAGTPEIAQASIAVKAALLGALALMLLFAGWILRSRTGVAGGTIRQSWWWQREAALDSLVNVKFVYLPYLAWLVAPRLIVRTREGRVVQFNAADPAVLATFAAITLALRRKDN